MGKRGKKPVPADVRFDQHIYPDPNSGCFIWAGTESRPGSHGVFTVQTGRTNGAHRFAWERVHGAVPPGLHVLHKCDTPCCVNPDHLFLGTTLDNHVDKAKKWRGIKSKRGLPFGVAPSRGRYQAVISVRGKSTGFGTYATIEEASAVAMAAKAAYHASLAESCPTS
jgi:hypothetical protein